MASDLPPTLLLLCDTIACELVRLMDDDDRLMQFDAMNLQNLAKCLKEIGNCNIDTSFDIDEEHQRCVSLGKELQVLHRAVCLYAVGCLGAPTLFRSTLDKEEG